MQNNARASQPFKFMSRLHLTELTGLRAATLGQLAALIKSVPGSCIYHHTHHFLQQHEYLVPEPTNDFACWVSSALNEDELGEELAGIDTVSYPNIRALREAIVEVIEKYLARHPFSRLKFCWRGQEFFFMKSVSFVVPTPYEAFDLSEFAAVLRKITVDSIYYHMFESRLRLEKPTNDFSLWIGESLGNKRCAERIARLDPYASRLEDLRRGLLRIVETEGSCVCA